MFFVGANLGRPSSSMCISVSLLAAVGTITGTFESAISGTSSKSSSSSNLR